MPSDRQGGVTESFRCREDDMEEGRKESKVGFGICTFKR